jgi:hypothetical protein
MFLGAPFALPLGGETVSAGEPFIVNIAPAPGLVDVHMLKPINFSVREPDEGVDPTTMRVKTGFAKVFSDGTAIFDELPGTQRVALNTAPAPEASISLVPGGVKIQKTSNSKQRSVFATTIEAGPGYESALLNVTLTPTQISADPAFDTLYGPLDLAIRLELPVGYRPEGSTTLSNGTILGIEHGPRNKVFYLWFQENDIGTKLIRVTSYLDPLGGSPTINTAIPYDWSGTKQYSILWNEAEAYAEIYGELNTGAAQRIFRVTLSSIPTMPEGYFARAGGPSEIIGLYGQLGVTGDNSIFRSVAFTKDVGYPLLGTIRPGDFLTQISGAEIIRTPGNIDPREREVSNWFTTPTDIQSLIDTSAVGSSSGDIFAIEKRIVNTTYSIYREEPGLSSSSTDAFMIQAAISADNDLLDINATGMGITIFDGQSVFQLQMFSNNSFRTIGLLRKGGNSNDITQHFVPSTDFDWFGERPFRFVVDPIKNALRFYDCADLGIPTLDIPFDRSTIPSGSDFTWAGKNPFVIFGHITPVSATGTFRLREIDINHSHQNWNSDDGVEPYNVLNNPRYSQSVSGGASSSLDSAGYLSLSSPYGGLNSIFRTIPLEPGKGGILETSLRINTWRPNTKTGLYLLMDDGTRVYGITFVDSKIGKFVAIMLRNGSGFSEIIGRDGTAADLCFPIDWTDFHTYRIERYPVDGFSVFVDFEKNPRITVSEANLVQLPDTQFSGTPTIAFGQLTIEGSTSQWDFVRTYFSKGYEISFKKNATEEAAVEELSNTQAIVVAHITD